MGYTFPIMRVCVYCRMQKTGRPNKLERFNEVAQEVLFDERGVGACIMHTDMDLLDMINRKLEPEERVSVRTFKAYKAGELQDEASLDVFSHLYKRALEQQKASLFESLRDEPPGAWQKWAWILERKFDEWSLRQRVVDETSAPKQLVLRVKRDE
jgi:hypothetical protein